MGISDCIFPAGKHVLLYDGDCGFCNFWVQWILEKDKKDAFRFASLQSGFGQSFLQKHHLKTQDFDTVYLLVSEDQYFTKADAAGMIGKILGGRYAIFSFLMHLPKCLKNPFYDLVARNRKKIMGSYCLLPTPEQRAKFIA